MTPLEKFLHDVHEIHSSRAAVDETPYYGSLEVLFNEVGKTLKPRVRCIIHPQNVGAGLPDGGFFEAQQFDKRSGAQPREGQLPARNCTSCVTTLRNDAAQAGLFPIAHPGNQPSAPGAPLLSSPDAAFLE